MDTSNELPEDESEAAPDAAAFSDEGVGDSPTIADGPTVADDEVIAFADEIIDEGDAPTAQAAEEVEATAAAGTPPDKPRSERRKGGKGEPRPEPGPMEMALRRFQACGRCSYFVAGCQIQLGREAVRTAIEQGPKDWLTLEWAEGLRHLTHDFYIANDDVFYFYYDGTCPECRRRYTYVTEPLDELQPMFRLQY